MQNPDMLGYRLLQIEHWQKKIDLDLTAVNSALSDLRIVTERLDLTTVKRDGPIINRLTGIEASMTMMQREALTKDEIAEALREHRGQSWSLARAIFVSVCLVAALIPPYVLLFTHG